MFTFFESQPHTRAEGDANQAYLALTHEDRQAFAQLGLHICQIIQAQNSWIWA